MDWFKLFGFKSAIPEEKPPQEQTITIEKRENFFKELSGTLFKQLSPTQITGINHILDSCRKYGITDNRQIAYILATVYFETNKTMQPVGEAYWLSKDTREYYLKSKKYY